MKKKLIYVFFMLAGAASIAAIVLLSQGKYEYHDASPVYTLIFICIVAIAAAAWLLSNAMDKSTSSGRRVDLQWVFRAVVIIATLAGFVFIIIELFPVSPLYSLLLFFIAIFTAALIIAAWLYEEEPEELEITRVGTVFLWIFRIVSILTILAGLAFIVLMWFHTGRYYDSALQNVLPLMVLATLGISASALSLKLRTPVSGHGKARAARCIPIAAALAITAALVFVYLDYMPKYSVEEGLNILLSKQELSQKDIMGSHEITLRGSYVIDIPVRDTTYYDIDHVNSFGGNPYYKELFSYHCTSYGCNAGGLRLIEGYILFNPATGAYEYTRMGDQDKTYSPGDCPEFNWNLMYGKDGQRNAVLNLYFREWWPEGMDAVDKSRKNEVFFAGSGEWDATMKDVLYPHNLSEDDARVFLRSIGEDVLKAKLLEQINKMDSTHALERKEDNTVGLADIHTKDKTIEVFFFGTDIAIYQNGEIALKL